MTQAFETCFGCGLRLRLTAVNFRPVPEGQVGDFYALCRSCEKQAKTPDPETVEVPVPLLRDLFLLAGGAETGADSLRWVHSELWEAVSALIGEGAGGA